MTGQELRDQIYAIVQMSCANSDVPCDVCMQRADAVKAVVQARLDEQTAENRRLKAARSSWKAQAPRSFNRTIDEYRERAEQAEAKAERLRDRLDGCAEGEVRTLRTAILNVYGATIAMETRGKALGVGEMVVMAERIRSLLPAIAPDAPIAEPTQPAYPECTDCGAPTTRANALCQPCRTKAEATG